MLSLWFVSRLVEQDERRAAIAKAETAQIIAAAKEREAAANRARLEAEIERAVAVATAQLYTEIAVAYRRIAALESEVKRAKRRRRRRLSPASSHHQSAS